MPTTCITPWAFALAGLAAGPLHAADAITTDRPDYVESSDVVGKGRFQIETSVASERDAADGLKTRIRTTPTLLRLGVSDTLELRLESDGRTWARAESGAGVVKEKGWSDTAVGVKWRMQEGDDEKGTPGIAWLLHLDLASGSSAFRGDGVRPSLRVVGEWDLGHEVSVGVMPGLALERDDQGRRFASGILAATLGKAWTPAWRTYVEVAGQQLASSRHGGSIVTFDTGVTWLVAESFQLDLSLQRGLTHAAPDFSWALGASVRF